MGPYLYKRGFDDETEILKSRLASATLLLEIIAIFDSLTNATKSIKDFFVSVGKILKEKLKYKYVEILVKDEKNPTMLTLLNPSDNEDVKTVSINRGIIGKTMREKRVIKVPDVSLENEYINVHPDTKSELCIPLLNNGEAIGALNIESDNFYTFDSESIGFAEMIAQHLSNYIRLASLYQTEEQFHRLVESMGEGVWVGNAHGKTIYTNSALQKMIGYEAHEITERSDHEFVEENSKKIILEENEKRKRGEHGHYEIKIIAKNGEKIPVLINAVPFGKDGSMAVLTDLRTLKTTEKRLLETEQFLAAITQNCMEAIVGLDENGVIMSWNVGAERMFGYKQEEVLQKHIKTLYTEESKTADEFTHLLNEVKDKGFIRNREVVRVHKNGNPLEVYINASALKDKQGKFLGVSALYRDVTPHKKWEKELQDRYEKIQEAYREMGRQRRHLDYLVDFMNMALSKSSDIKQLGAFVVNAMIMVAKVDAATLRMLDAEKGKLVLKAQTGVGNDWWNKKNIPYPGSLTEESVKKGQPLKILDLLNEPRYDSPAMARKNNLRSALLIPLEVKGEVLGSIMLYISNESNLSLLDNEFITIFAKQAALALKLAKDTNV